MSGIHVGKTTMSGGGHGTRRILMTEGLREELAQAAAATSQAYAVGVRNLSMASMTNATGTHYIETITNKKLFSQKSKK
jgi:hypothetical protein